MDAFELADVAAEREASERPYLEFITVPDLSVGLYVLAAGQPDLQQPHTEDEVYYVVDGSAQIEVAGERQAVRPGSVVFVAAGVDHRFHDIEKDLKVLVFWAPPRHTRKA